MKTLTKLVIAIASLCAASVHAQVVIQDFSNVFDNNLNFFYGTWEATNNPGGTLSPNANFIQGAGVYSITGAAGIIPTENAASQLEFFNASPTSIGANQYLAVTFQTLAGNAASSFTVTLKDTAGKTAFAAFSLGAPAAPVTLTQLLTFSGGFNSTAIDSVVLSGNNPIGSAVFSAAFDNISAVATAPIPEPTTYAAILGVASLGLAAYRRRIRSARAA
jgi:hypothetical protein